MIVFRYHYLVFSFMQDEETELELPFTEEELQVGIRAKLLRIRISFI
jgi:hypothetical protein